MSTRRGIIIEVSKVRRNYFKRPNQHRFVVKARNHKIVATGEEYANLADLCAAVMLITGVAIQPVVGQHLVGFYEDGTYFTSVLS